MAKSKRFKGKTCVYCGKPNCSTTGDHVFAREFFLPDKRGNLPKVPACKRCNGDKSELEHYLTAVFPFGACHADAATHLEEMVPPRLAKNRKLHYRLAQERDYSWVHQNGLFRPTMKLPFDSTKLNQLFCLIVKGLMWYHWSVLLTSDVFVRAGCLMNKAEQLFQNFFNKNASQRVIVDLGDGTIHYEGVQGVDSPYLSLWKFLVYGGLRLGDDPIAPSEISSLIWGLTGRSKIIPDLWDRQ